MGDAVVSEPYVVLLMVQNEGGSVSGLSAEVARTVEVDSLVTCPTGTVEVWSTLNSGQRSQFGKLVKHILGLA